MLLAVLALAASPALAQAPAAPWSPKAFVAAALETSPEVEQARQVLASADAAYGADLFTAVLPSLSFSANAYPWGNNPGNGYAFNSWRLNRRETSVNAGLTWTLFNSFQDSLQARFSYQSREIARRALDDVLQAQALKALQGFHDLRLNDALAGVARRDLETQQAQYGLTQDLYRHGMKSLSDLLKTETDWRSSELRLESAQAARKLSAFRFTELLARAPEEAVSLEAAVPPEASALPPLDEDLRRAAVERPDMARLRLENDRTRTAFLQSVRGAAPSLSFAYQRNYQEYASFGLPSSGFGIRNPNHYFALNLSLPTGFNFGTQYEKVRGARADRSASDAARRALERTVRDDVYSARVALDAARRSYAVSAIKEDIAKRNLELVTEQYRQGSADVIRLSQAQLDHVTAQVERMRALHDADVSRAQYRKAVGEPLWR
ncbi:MAG TPA: TolC family protein [Elusimicrobiota bacterium]|nr:TolC family protein [Elusimicrobiota bacterium]